jgi:tetratricopeptide (TPR) repeat protein
MNRLTSLAIFSLVLTLAASCAKGPGGESGGPYSDAMKAVEESRFDAADSLLAELAKSDSAGYYTTYGQGVSYEHQLLFCDALQSYLLTVSRFPDSGAALAGLSRMFAVLDDPDEAVVAAHRWSEAEKGNNEARFRLIRSQIEASAYPLAEQSLEDARKVGLDKNVGDLLQARLQVISHQDGAAAKSATQAQTEGSESPDFLLALADYYDERGQVDSAVLAGTKSYEMTHDVFYGYLNFRRCLKHRYFTAARAFINDIAKDGRGKVPSTAALLEYKVAADDRAQLSRVIDVLTRLRPERYTPLFLGTAARECIGDMNMAHQCAIEIQALYSQDGVYPPFRGFLRWYGFNQAYNRWPYPPPDVMGFLDSLKGWREALPRFQAMAAGALLQDTLIATFHKRGDSLIAANAENLNWLTTLGFTFSEAAIGRQLGNKAFGVVLARDPQALAARCGLIDNALVEFKYDEALTIMAADPTFIDRCPDYGLQKALCEVMLGKTAEAVASFERSYPSVRGEISRVEPIALALVRQGKTSEALQVVTRCLELCPKDADACLLASDVQYKLGSYQLSLDQAEKGLQLEPEHACLKSYKARALYALGQKEEGKKLLSDLLAKSPSDPDASMVLSRIMADENADPERAQNLARQAQAFGRISSRPTINLAYVYTKIGRYDLAMGAAQEATVIYPNDPEAYYYLGMSLFNAKRPGAKENLQKGISFGLMGEQLKTARETLNKI